MIPAPRAEWTEAAGREAVARRATGGGDFFVCEVTGTPWALEWSHRIAAGRGGTYAPSNGLLLNHDVHAWAHRNPAAACRLGWHVRTGFHPVDVPVWLARPWAGFWFLRDDEGPLTPAHPEDYPATDTWPGLPDDAELARIPAARRERSPPVTLHIVPVSFETACGFIEMWHRHHPPPQGHKFSIGVASDDRVLRGVATVGRPVARHYDDGRTLEVNRTATDGTPHANSALYGAAWRAAKALGYLRLITYTHAEESGSSLRGAGWRVVACRPARGGWDVPSRPREDRGTGGIPRMLWEATA